MSCLTRETKSRTGYRLRAYTAAGRRSIWLGDIPEAQAVAIQRHVDEILASQTADLPLPRQTARFLDELPAAMRAKLQAITGAARTLQTAIDEYIDARHADLSESTLADRERSLAHLQPLSGRKLDRITAKDVEDIHASLDCGPSTRGKIASAWKAFFAWCMERHWINDNPARPLPSTVSVRQKQFVSSETIDAVIRQCTDPGLRVAIAMSRYGGIRMMSELRGLDRSDIDWQRKRITIHDSKRKRDRVIPLFPELEPTLADHPDGPLCDDLLRLTDSAITQRFLAELRKCNVEPWPSPWHAMRASRETELIQRFGLSTAAIWIGNSESVAMRSYAVVTDQHWSAAIEPIVDTPPTV
jgi:integrase